MHVRTNAGATGLLTAAGISLFALVLGATIAAGDISAAAVVGIGILSLGTIYAA